MINFAAQEYYELINWDFCKLSSPPLLNDVRTDMIMDLLKSGEIPEWNFHNFPNHTQAVERCVKLVTKILVECAAPKQEMELYEPPFCPVQ